MLRLIINENENDSIEIDVKGSVGYVWQTLPEVVLNVLRQAKGDEHDTDEDLIETFAAGLKFHSVLSAFNE